MSTTPDPPAPGTPAGRHRPTLVVGHDRHRAARAALDAAIALAGDLGAEVHIVHSVTLGDCGIDPDTEEFEAERERNLAKERAEITAILRSTNLVWTYHEEHGDPAHALAHRADQVDATYVVVGATHPGALRHLVGGDSVVKRLLKSQHRPVVVVPEPADTRSAPSGRGR